jgi:hypothetical protein
MGCCFAGVWRFSPASALPAMAPLVVLRDGRKREFALLPEGIACDTYIDRYQRPVHVLLDPASERLLLASQPRRRRAPRRRAQVPGHGTAAA